MKNKYEIRGDEAIIFLNYKGEALETRISLSKLERVMAFPNTWYASRHSHGEGFYVHGDVSVNGIRNRLLLHRWITESDNLHIDHWDNDTLNNTDQNLRQLTNAENHQNRKGAQSNSKSGVRGVYWSKGAWTAEIRVNRRKTHIGRYNSVEEAEFVVKLARAENMPFSKEAARANSTL